MKKLFILIVLPLMVLGQSAYNPVFVAPPVGGGGNVSNPPINVKDYGAIGDELSHPITAADIATHTDGNPTHYQWRGTVARRVTDGSITNGGTTVVSATAAFTGNDVGRPIRGTGIPPNSWIYAINSANNASIDGGGPCTATATGVTVDIGWYREGDEWDYVGIQEGIFNAFHGRGGSLTYPYSYPYVWWPNNELEQFNIPLHIPAGHYVVNMPPTMVNTRGGYVYGDGKLATVITSTGSNIPAWEIDGIWYTTFQGMQFAGSVSNTASPHPVAVFNCDAKRGRSLTGLAGQPYPIYSALVAQNLLTQQGCTWRDVMFYGNSVVLGLFALTQYASNGQGDTNVFINCHFTSPSPGGYGYLQVGSNALANGFYTSNFSACDTGLSVSGTVFVDNCLFQGLVKQQVNRGGFDIVVSIATNQWCMVRNSRSESAKRFSVAANDTTFHWINNGVSMPVPDGFWAASTAYTQGQIVKGTDPPSGKGNGHLFLCVTSGTSGSTEPSWPSEGQNNNFNSTLNAQYGTGSAITSGTNALAITGVNPRIFHAADVGKTIQVVGAGAAGADLYTTIAGYTDATHVTLTANAGTTVSGARWCAGTLINDNTAKWIIWDYDEAIGTGASGLLKVEGSTFLYGRTRIFGNMSGNTFARMDSFCDTVDPNISSMLRYGMNDQVRGSTSYDGNLVVLNGGINNGSSASASTYFSNPLSRGWANRMSLYNRPLFFEGGSGSGPWKEVGFFRGDGTHLSNGDASFSDGVTTAGAKTFSSATATFTASDKGKDITGGSLPYDTVVASITDAQNVVLSQNAGSSASGVFFTIRDRTANADQHLYHDIIGVEGTIGKLARTGTNAPGRPLIISGGLGTGSGGGGPVRIMSQPVTTSGTTVIDPIETMNFQYGRASVSSLLRLTPKTFATVSGGAEGDIAYITDGSTATHGATVAGGGSSRVVMIYDGTNWKVFYP